MTLYYLDTSAALKLLVDEEESTALAQHLDTTGPRLVAVWLLETELRRAAHRLDGVSQAAASEVLAGVDLHGMPGSLFREAGQLLPGAGLRSLDALHLAAALRLGVDAILTYDQRLAGGAVDLGLTVLSPS